MGNICSPHASTVEQAVSRKDLFSIKNHSILHDYTFIKVIGYGQFGEVRLAEHKISKVQVAVKRVTINPQDKGLKEMIYNEIKILVKCDHPNIIRIFDAYQEPRFTYIVEEYIQGCLPMARIFEIEGEFNEGNRIIAVEQVLHAVNYLHSNNLVHRDIKPENIIYAPCVENPNDLNNVELKLIDFGFARTSYKNENDMIDFVGTPYFIAPEIIGDSAYGNGCDIWSLGVLTYYIIEGDYPFKSSKKKELFQKITGGRVYFESEVWKSVSADCKNFILNCLTVDPSERPSAARLLEHPWIKSKPRAFIQKLENQSTFNQNIKSNLATLQRMNSFQWTLISYMNQLNLYQNEMKTLRQQFESVDKNGDGTLSYDEIRDIMVLHIGTEDYDEFTKLLKIIDADKSGKIDYSEFINLISDKKKLLSRENLAVTFKVLDLDSNGVLTIEELRKTFEAGGNKKTKKFWKDFMQQIDANHDNEISFDEFVSYMEELLI